METQSHCTNCFKSLGVSSRMKMYSYLAHTKEATVGQIVEHVGVTQPTVSYHLTDMKKNGILTSFKKEKEVHYSLTETCPHFNTACVLKGVTFPHGAESTNYEHIRS